MGYSKLELIYFRLRALAEAPQMMLKFAGIDYSYIMANEYFNKPWKEAKAGVAFNQLPLLIVDEKIEIWQSNSIVRFLATITGTMPENKMIAAQAAANAAQQSAAATARVAIVQQQQTTAGQQQAVVVGIPTSQHQQVRYDIKSNTYNKNLQTSQKR